MDTSIRIQLMNTFAIYIDTQEANQLLAKSRKGVLYFAGYEGRKTVTSVPNAISSAGHIVKHL